MFEDDTKILENEMMELNLKERSTQDEDEGTMDTKQEKDAEQGCSKGMVICPKNGGMHTIIQEI